MLRSSPMQMQYYSITLTQNHSHIQNSHTLHSTTEAHFAPPHLIKAYASSILHFSSSLSLFIRPHTVRYEYSTLHACLLEPPFFRLCDTYHGHLAVSRGDDAQRDDVLDHHKHKIVDLKL